MTTVVVSFDEPLRVRCVSMVSVQVCADLLEGCKVLYLVSLSVFYGVRINRITWVTDAPVVSALFIGERLSPGTSLDAIVSNCR